MRAALEGTACIWNPYRVQIVHGPRRPHPQTVEHTSQSFLGAADATSWLPALDVKHVALPELAGHLAAGGEPKSFLSLDFGMNQKDGGNELEAHRASHHQDSVGVKRMFRLLSSP